MPVPSMPLTGSLLVGPQRVSHPLCSSPETLTSFLFTRPHATRSESRGSTPENRTSILFRLCPASSEIRFTSVNFFPCTAHASYANSNDVLIGPFASILHEENTPG